MPTNVFAIATVAVSLALTAGIFVVDLRTPLGLPVWLFYVVPILLLSPVRRPVAPFALAAFCSLLSLGCLYWSPPGLPESDGLVNRLVGVVLLGLAAFFAASGNGESSRHDTALNQRLAATLAGAGVLLVLLSVASFQAATFNRDSQHVIAQNHETLLQLSGLRSAVTEAEAAQSRFLLSGRESYVETYHQAVMTAKEYLRRLPLATQGDPMFHGALSVLERTVPQVLEVFTARIMTGRETQAGQAGSTPPADQEKLFMEDIRSTIREMEVLEQRQLSRRTQLTETMHLALLSYLGLGGLLQIGLLVGAAQLVRQRQRAELAREEGTQAALRYFEGIVEAIRTPLLVLDDRLVVQSANRSFHAAFGTTKDDTQGRPISEVGKGLLDIEQLKVCLGRILPERTEVSEVEIHCELNPAGTRTFHINARPLDRPGMIGGYILLAMEDVTDRKRLEEPMRRLAAIVESSDDAIVGKTLDGVVTSWNAGAERLFGYKAEEMIGHSITRLLPPDRLQEEGSILERLRRGERLDQFESIRRRKDGRLVEVSLTISPVKDGQGTVIGASNISRDITERKRAEAEIRNLYDRAPCGYHSLDQDGRFVNINQTELEWLGYTREEVIGKMRFADVLTHQSLDRFQLMFPVFKQQGEVRGLEFELIRKDGTVLPVLLNASAITDAEGRYVSSRSTVFDISQRKKTEEALQRAHDELEERVVHRTMELMQKNRDLETLLYVTSHDLREPLRSIENFSRIVQDRYADRLDEKGRDFLQRVVRGARRMDRLMADVLALSRVQRMELPFEEVEGAALVEDALRQLEGSIKERRARVRVADHLPRLRVNKMWVTQAICNLIANALKFTREEEAPEVVIKPYYSRDGEPREIGFIVADAGPGVAPEHADRIFELFQRAVGREIEGTGAGLAIVRRIAERHGGRAWVQPREGGGSLFAITFGPPQPDQPTGPLSL